MNTYRIRYKGGMRGAQLVKADTVNGFQPTHDTYLFKIERIVDLNGEATAADTFTAVAQTLICGRKTRGRRRDPQRRATPRG